MALIIVDVQLLATLNASEAVFVPNQTLGLRLFHLKDDLAAAAAVRIRVTILAHLKNNEITYLLMIMLKRLFLENKYYCRNVGRYSGTRSKTLTEVMQYSI